MQNSQLEIVITAKDEASAKVQSFAGKIKNMQPVFKSMAVAGGVAFAGITAFANEAVKAAQEAEQAQAQLGAVLKSTGNAAGLYADEILDQSKALQKLTTYSDEAILSAQNLLLTFTNVKGPIFQDSIETILDMSTALGQDLKSSSIQVGKALNDPIRGITALSRVGVSFSEEQKKVIETFVKTGQVAEAQKVILAELSREFGGSASAAADTYAGKVAQLKNQFNEAQEQIGTLLIPMLQQLLSVMVPIIEKTIAWIEAHPELTKWILIVSAALSGLALAIGTLGVLLPGIILAFGALSPAIFVIIGIVGGLALAITNVTKIMALFRDSSDEIWSGLKIMFKGYIDDIIGYFKPLVDMLDNIIAKLSSIGASVKSNVSNSLSSVSKFFGGGKAQGGNVMGGSTYLVGERGPEYFTPKSNGSILPSGSLVGGSSITININGGTYLSESVAHDIGDMIIDRFKKVARI